MNFLSTYGTTTGPVGIPMTDDQAFALESVLKKLPAEDQAPRKARLDPAIYELEVGERADISWISTEAIDRDREVVLAKGLNDSHFQLNPLVTVNHRYDLPPVGKSLWRKFADEPHRRGVIAKTHYPAKPEAWTDAWPPDFDNSGSVDAADFLEFRNRHLLGSI